MKLLASLLMAAALAAPTFAAVAADEKPAAAPQAPKIDLVKGEASYTAMCAQQHPEYLVKQLQDFKSGKRKNAVMQGFASALSDEDMRNVSFWVASKAIKPGFAKDKELVSLGERIYRGGIADRQVPACAACHSPNGAGIPIQFPRLGAQHADYTAAQLVAFRDGVRKNSIPMTGVAAKMNDREIKAVSDYIAGLK